MKIGRRLAIKLLNASQVRPRPRVDDGRASHRAARPVDAGRAGRPGRRGHRAFDGYDYARALERTEGFFWAFCDDYLELVKGRAYGADGEPAPASARTALGLALRTLLRLFAPFLPFVTEEVWSWWQEGSVHRRRGRRPTPCARPPSARRASPGDEPTRRCWPWPPPCSARSAGPRARPSGRCAPRSTSATVTDTARPPGAAGAGRGRRPPRRPHRRPAHGRATPSRSPSSWPPSSRLRRSFVPGRRSASAGAAVGRVGARPRLVRRARVAADPGRRGGRCRCARRANALTRRRRSSRRTLNCSAGRVLTTSRMAMPSALEPLDAPHLGLLEDLAAPLRVLPQLVGDRLDDRPAAVSTSVPVGHLDVEQRPGPLLGLVADPEDLAVRDVPDRAAARRAAGSCAA